MSKIGIITWHHYPNVGSALQAYALQRFLNTNGYNAEFINYREFHRPKLESLRAFLCSIDCVVPHWLAEKLNYRYPHFTKNYLPQTKPVYSADGLPEIASRYETVICGSDQIWAPSVFNRAYFLSFVGRQARKISYAASIGLPRIPEHLKPEYKRLLADFDAISVREEEGARLLADIGINADVVCDPTFLLPADEYRKIFGKIKVAANSYLFCYFLGENRKHREMAREMANKLGKQLVLYSSFDEDAQFADVLAGHIGPREFLHYVADATMVMTDSFHGIAFSIIFRKDFYALERFTADDPNNQNSRVYNILRRTGLDDRLLRGKVPNELKGLDWTASEKFIESMIADSKKYLLSNI